jgi:hypothetical protein
MWIRVLQAWVDAHELHGTVRQQRRGGGGGKAARLPAQVAEQPLPRLQPPVRPDQHPIEAKVREQLSRLVGLLPVMMFCLLPLMLGHAVAFCVHGRRHPHGLPVLERLVRAQDIAAWDSVRWLALQALHWTNGELAVAPLPEQDPVVEAVRGAMHGLLGVLYACSVVLAVLAPFYLRYIGCAVGEYNNAADMLYVLYTDLLRLRRWLVVDCAPVCGHLLTAPC